MADAGLPLVRVRMPGPLGIPQEWDAWITAWVRRDDGWHAELFWHENADGAPCKALLPAEFLLRKRGQDYRQVKRRVVEPATARPGRVATGHEWRRTG